jgi:PsbP
MKVLLVRINSKGILNKIKICSIYVSICIIFVSILINSSYAQSADNSSNAQTSDNFLNYKNNDNGFTIQYPAEWKVKETGFDPSLNDVVVQFMAPDYSDLTVHVNDVSQYLDTDTMTLKNTTLAQHVQNEVSILSNLALEPNWIYKPIRSHEFPLAGKQGWKLEHILGYLNQKYQMRVYTIANDKVYELSYIASPSSVPKTFPLANKMVESFQLK